MFHNHAEVSTFLEAFVRWAANQPDIRAVALVGSYARETPAEGSDVDLLILTTDVAKYLLDTSWVFRFGQVKTIRKEDWGKVTSLRAFYGDGLEIEYGFSSLEWANIPLDDGSYRVVSDGMKILYDPLEILSAVWSAVTGDGRSTDVH